MRACADQVPDGECRADAAASILRLAGADVIALAVRMIVGLTGS
jgi:hypothetical protein